MMYRSGWSQKENQEHVLAIKIKRTGFEWALQNSCLSHFDKSLHTSYEEWKEALKNTAVRIQWDPEKDIFLQQLPYRSIQIGLSGIAVEKYVKDWIVSVEDISDECKVIHRMVLDGKVEEAEKMLPDENPYAISESLAKLINADYLKRAL